VARAKGTPGVLAEVLKGLLSKPITEPYAPEFVDEHPNYRGRPTLNPEKCTGCRWCFLVCPARAITMVRVGTRKVGTRELPLENPRIDYFRCIYCGMCVYACEKAGFNALYFERTLPPLHVGPKPSGAEQK